MHLSMLSLTPSLDALNTLGQCGDLSIYIYNMLFEFHYNYKIPTSGHAQYISDRRRTNPEMGDTIFTRSEVRK